MRMQTGSIHYRVSIELTRAQLHRVQRAGGLSPSEQTRDLLEQVAFTWTERCEMRWADFQEVRAIFDKLLLLAAKRDPDALIDLVERLATFSEETHPSEAYVYDTILSELGIGFEPAWREQVRNGEIDTRALYARLKATRDRMDAGYRGRRGGSRDHDLGWLLSRLATIYVRAGGKITVWWRLNDLGGTADPAFVYDSPFVRFARAFIALLQRRPGVTNVDVGALVMAALPDLRASTGAFAGR